MNKVRWGILSTAKIGRKNVIPAMQQCTQAEVKGIASRNLEDAKNTANELGIPLAFGSYQAMLESPEIDAVYIPLPNHLHLEWILKSLDAGKHVLCEKPLVLKTQDIDAIREKAKEKGRKVGEAFMVKTAPQWLKAKEIIQSGSIGRLKSIHGFFSYFNDDPKNIRNNPAYGGGGLWDIGCYPITLSRFILEEEPLVVFGVAEKDPDFQVDRVFSGLLSFPSCASTFTASTQMVPYQRMQFFGTEKMLELQIPFNAPIDAPSLILLHSGSKEDADAEQIIVPASNQYTIQGDAFSRAIMENTDVPVSLQDTLDNTKIILALLESASSGGAISLA